jgi:hypothetical protein
LKNVLEPQGHRISTGDGSPLCDIWLRAGVPSQSKKEVSGVLYPQLAESTLIAVISFPQAFADYRGEGIKAGLYTLRYELIPQDGNHLGVAENRDFALLIPAASDPDPAATFNFSDLVRLSSRSTGSRHPAPVSLTQAGAGVAPAVYQDESDHWIFSTGLKLASGEIMPIALVVKGSAPQ